MDHGYYVPELPKVEGVVASTSLSCQSKKTVKLKEIQKKKESYLKHDGDCHRTWPLRA